MRARHHRALCDGVSRRIHWSAGRLRPLARRLHRHQRRHRLHPHLGCDRRELESRRRRLWHRRSRSGRRTSRGRVHHSTERRHAILGLLPRLRHRELRDQSGTVIGHSGSDGEWRRDDFADRQSPLMRLLHRARRLGATGTDNRGRFRLPARPSMSTWPSARRATLRLRPSTTTAMGTASAASRFSSAPAMALSGAIATTLPATPGPGVASFTNLGDGTYTIGASLSNVDTVSTYCSDDAFVEVPSSFDETTGTLTLDLTSGQVVTCDWYVIPAEVEPAIGNFVPRDARPALPQRHRPKQRAL